MMLKYKNKWMGIVLAAAIVLNTLLPFFATYSEASPPSGLASVFGEKVLICTGQGFALVKWEDLMAGKTPVKRHKSYSCPLCYIANSNIGKMLLLAAGAIYLSREKAVGGLLFSHYGTSLKSFARVASRPRAPPVPFSY